MKLNGSVINPGDLKTRIIIAKRSSQKDAGGFRVESLEYVTQVWSRWKNVHGTEAVLADVKDINRPATVLMRYLQDFDETYLVVKDGIIDPIIVDEVVTGYNIVGGTIYQVISIDDIEAHHEYMELAVRGLAAA